MINDDLNTAKGLAILWNVLQDDKISPGEKLALVFNFDQVLGLGLADVKICQSDGKIPIKIEQLKKQRDKARANKDFTQADKLRIQIKNSGFQAIDTAKGTMLIKLPTGVPS